VRSVLIAERVKRAADQVGGIPTLARKIKVGRQTLYDIVEKGHVPSGRTLIRLLARGVLKRADLTTLDAA
jgi:DNA-binding phage protein